MHGYAEDFFMFTIVASFLAGGVCALVVFFVLRWLKNHIRITRK